MAFLCPGTGPLGGGVCTARRSQRIGPFRGKPVLGPSGACLKCHFKGDNSRPWWCFRGVFSLGAYPKQYAVVSPASPSPAGIGAGLPIARARRPSRSRRRLPDAEAQRRERVLGKRGWLARPVPRRGRPAPGCIPGLPEHGARRRFYGNAAGLSAARRPAFGTGVRTVGGAAGTAAAFLRPPRRRKTPSVEPARARGRRPPCQVPAAQRSP